MSDERDSVVPVLGLAIPFVGGRWDGMTLMTMNQAFPEVVTFEDDTNTTYIFQMFDKDTGSPNTPPGCRVGGRYVTEAEMDADVAKLPGQTDDNQKG